MDLFQIAESTNKKKLAPLAERLKPQSLEEFFGQQHLVGSGKFLRRAIEADQLRSVLLYGPPGSGKTSLARIISETTKAIFVQLNAVTSGVKDIREVVDEAKQRLAFGSSRTILFIDEIHRFNKSQQDALLPHVEDGTLILIGATTENPYFEVNSALISRSMVLKLEPLTEDSLNKIIDRALEDPEKGYGNRSVVLTDDARAFLIQQSAGDARKVLNGLELAVLTTPMNAEAAIYIDLEVVRQCIQRKGYLYDKAGDQHYDVISAFIKSLRGSDPDGAVHYLARMIEAGEDIEFIARRLVIAASEDVGNADPMALVLASQVFQMVRVIGMPESRILLSQAATYIATAPKSNASYVAINQALSDLENKNIGTVPPHLRDSAYGGAKKLGHGLDYLYPHNFPGHWVSQQYLPDALLGTRYYTPDGQGIERKPRTDEES